MLLIKYLWNHVALYWPPAALLKKLSMLTLFHSTFSASKQMFKGVLWLHSLSLTLTYLLLLYLMYSKTHRCRLKIHSFFLLPSLTFQHPVRDSRRTKKNNNFYFAFVLCVLKYLIVDSLHDSRVITRDKIMVFADSHNSSEICWTSWMYVCSIIPYTFALFCLFMNFTIVNRKDTYSTSR